MAGEVSPYNGSILDVGSLPEDYNIQDMIEMMKNQGIMPMNSTTVNDINHYPMKEVVNMLVLAGDLLSTGDITPKEWHRLKRFIQSENPENVKLADEILKAKSE